jgi:hypothetical protein
MHTLPRPIAHDQPRDSPLRRDGVLLVRIRRASIGRMRSSPPAQRPARGERGSLITQLVKDRESSLLPRLKAGKTPTYTKMLISSLFRLEAAVCGTPRWGYPKDGLESSADSGATGFPTRSPVWTATRSSRVPPRSVWSRLRAFFAILRIQPPLGEDTPDQLRELAHHLVECHERIL